MDDEFLLCKNYLARFDIQLNFNSLDYYLTTEKYQVKVYFKENIIYTGLQLAKMIELEEDIKEEKDFRKRRKMQQRIHKLAGILQR